MLLYKTLRKIILGMLFVSLLGLLACTAVNQSGVYYATSKDSVTADGLHRVLWEPFEITFVRPGAKLSEYDAVIVDRVRIGYKRTPKGTLSSEAAISPNYKLSPEEIAGMADLFKSTLVKTLTTQNHFKVATEAGPKVLRIGAHILDLTITAPPQNQQAGDETTYVSSSGNMTLVLNVEDSETNTPLVRVGDRRDIALYFQNSFYAADNTTNSIALKSLFQGWATRLNDELDQLSSIPEIPAPPRKEQSANTGSKE